MSEDDLRKGNNPFSINKHISKIIIAMDKLELSKNFANKIWNASKFVISNLDLKDKFDTSKVFINKQ